MPSPSRSTSLQNPPAVKADSVRPGAVRRVLAGLAALALVLGAGCGEARPHGPASAQRRVPVAASAEPRRHDFGSHPVAVRELRVAHDGLYGALYSPTDVKTRMPALVAFGGSDGGLKMRGY